MSDKFYPKLSRLINLDVLPEQLDFIESGIQQIIDNMYYRNYPPAAARILSCGNTHNL